MVIHAVKVKLVRRLSFALSGLAVTSLFLSLTGWIPENLVETLYSRRIYPLVSSMMGYVADAVGFSWLDILIPVSLVGIVSLAYRRKLFHLISFLATAYLVFFWTWGLNYHRPALATKLDFDADRVNAQSVAALAEETAIALNNSYPLRRDTVFDDDRLAGEAGRRVRAVIAELDGMNWAAGQRVKSSWLLNPVFRAAGVEGMFNPFGHEAIVTGGLLPFEMPMVVLHEVAHVRGYPNEGDANFIALMAALESSDVDFQYSGWLTLWFYVRSPEADGLLEQGPRNDVESVIARVASQRIDWVSRTQTQSLDLLLRAHRVEGGVESYAQIVNLAVGTRPFWGRFAD